MKIWEVLLLAVSLAMDALAVSVCKGLASGKVKIKYVVLCGAWFGVFQMLMPLVGFALAGIFANHLKLITPWVSFALLAFLGVKMLIEGIKERHSDGSEKAEKAVEENNSDGSAESPKTKKTKKEYGFVTMLLAAIATSIDALAVGVTFAFNGTSYNITVWNNIWLYIGIIGIVTFVIAAAGNAMGGGLGAAFGIRFKFIAELIGGIILIALGIKFLVEGIIAVCTAAPPAEEIETAVRSVFAIGIRGEILQ